MLAAAQETVRKALFQRFDIREAAYSQLDVLDVLVPASLALYVAVSGPLLHREVLVSSIEG